MHFSGKLLSDVDKRSISSVIFEDDDAGEILGVGKYPSIRQVLHKSVANTFDGIAVDENVRLIVFSGENFTGDTLLDVTGPILINNSLWEPREKEFGSPNTKTYTSTLESKFPAENRVWSESDMHAWQHGSFIILVK